MTAIQRLERFWCTTAPAERLAAFRIAVGVFTLHYLANRIGLLADVARTDPALFDPVGAASWLSTPLAPSLIDTLVGATLVANVAFVLGCWHRVSGPAFALLLLALLSYRNSWSMVYHSDNVLVFHALVLGLTRAADAWSFDAWWRGARGEPPSWRYGWPLRLAAGLAVSTYFLAGVAKVMGPLGWSWGSGDAMLGQILVDGLRKELLGSGAADLAFALHDQPALFGVLGSGTLVLELAAPLALLNPRAGRIWALAAFGMHWGVWAVMDIYFRYQMVGVLFLPFFNVERFVHGLRSALTRDLQPASHDKADTYAVR
jgi:hypothetical protein